MDLNDSYLRSKKKRVVHLMSTMLGKNAHLGWTDLPYKFLSQIEKYLNENEWELIRRYTDNVDEKIVITLNSIKAITDDEILKLKNTVGSKLSLYDFRNALECKVFSIFDDAVSEALLQPRAYENALVKAYPILNLSPILVCLVITIICSFYASENHTSGWWFVSGYCLFLSIMNLSSGIRMKQITAILRGNLSYVLMLYFLNPVLIIFFIIYLIV